MENLDSLQHAELERLEIYFRVEYLSNFFNLPLTIKERGRQSRIFFVSKDEMIKQAAEYEVALTQAIKNTSVDSTAETFIKEYLPDLHREEFWERDIETTISQDLKNADAIFIATANGQRSIYVDRNHTMSDFDKDFSLSHELLHSLSSEGFGGREGLKIVSRGGIFLDRLNEASTEILREFARREWNVDAPPNLSQIRDTLINENYQESAIFLMTSMMLTSLPDGKPITIRDLASYYFDINDKKGRNPIDFLSELTSSVPQQYIDRVTKLTLDRLF